MRAFIIQKGQTPLKKNITNLQHRYPTSKNFMNAPQQMMFGYNIADTSLWQNNIRFA